MNTRNVLRLLCLTALLCLAGMVHSSAALGQSEDGGAQQQPAASAKPQSDAMTGWGDMDAAERERAISYSSTRHTFYFIATAYSFVILLVILFTGFSARMLGWAEKVSSKRPIVLFLYLVMFLAVMAIASLPLDYYLGFHLEHQYGLSNQGLGSWLLDGLKSLGVAAIILWIVVGILYALLRSRPRTWWAWLGVVSVPLLLVLVVLAPILITPLFYKTTPMEDSPLKSQILDLAAQSGIPDSRVFVMDASRDTKKLNAYVTGLGQTKRIVLYDNLVAKMTPKEVLFVVGHEMGHYLLHHVWIGLFIGVALVFILGFISHLFMSKIIAVNQARFGFDHLASFASLPLIYLCFSALSFILSPVQNGIWRHFEHEADIFGLQKTHDSNAAVGAFEKMAAVNLSNPNPSAFIKFWLYDHPTLSERVQFASAYESDGQSADPLRHLGERHLSDIRQLTSGGENAEAYFDGAGQQLIFQSTRGDYGCDRIFTMNIDGSNLHQVSGDHGVTTCSFFAPDGKRVIYCSTHLVDDSCPAKPSYDKGYVWKLYAGYDVFSANPDGSDLIRLTDTPGYDAEAVYAPDGSKILFTSVRDGDLELYTMDPDGSNQTRLTHDLGYDGGGFFSPDGKRIVYRANHPATEAEIAEYRELLSEDLIRPSELEIFIMNADGSNRQQITENGAANFCPYFHPNGKQIIFASNMDDPAGRNFELYLINTDGTGLQRVTFNDSFDGFPMFNADGTKLVWASNRNNNNTHETNIFIADWTD